MVLLEFLDFLNKNSGAVNAISTIGLTIITLIYVLLTRNISKETKMMRIAQTEPNISAIIQSEEDCIKFIHLIIKNIGLGPAYNVKFKINPDYEDRILGGKLSEIGFIENGLPYFAPNQEFKIFLTNMAESYEEKMKKTFEIEVIYKSNIHKEYSNTYLIDFSQLRGLSSGESPLYRIANDIKKIREALIDPQQESNQQKGQG
ncbi:MAG: hypothetical protein FNP40_00375 [Dehalobacter sp. 4CP]|nr:hypothetical protein [Dehalobacter sp. 4CP]